VKVTLVGPTYPFRGGIAHYTALLYREFIACGHQVSLYSFKRQYPRWLFPGRTDRDPSVLKLDAECEYTLDSLNPLTWWATAEAIRARRPDVLILQWWVPFFAPMWIVLARVARQAGVRILFICHNVLPHESRLWDVWLTRQTLGLGDGFVVPSQEEKVRLLALLPGRRVEVAPHPIYDMFASQTIPCDEARRRLALPPLAPILLFFGFVREYKGLRYLLEALPAIRTEFADIQLLIVGEFWQDKQTYLDQIERLDIARNVVVVDRYVSNEEVPIFFAAADVVALPYTDVTQSGVVQLAFGFGLPVITTWVGGLAEVVADGETGLLVPPGDCDALAEGVKRYFREELKVRMTEAIQRIRGRFEWKKLVAVIEEMGGSDQYCLAGH
jgi:glycosyltransferase involved in cell wall biosynthesis